MKKLLLILFLILSAAGIVYASIGFRNQNTLQIGEGGGVSFHKPMSSIDHTGTYWGTARTSYWSNTRTALWSTARNTEI